MFQVQMTFYWWEKEGKICVQNMIAGVQGQYHEHTPEEFEKWKVGIAEDRLHKIEGKSTERKEKVG